MIGNIENDDSDPLFPNILIVLLYSLAKRRGCADSCNMAAFTFQPRYDMATELLLQLDTLGRG